MKILYGVQGTGNGHITRSREVIRELKSRGHQVHVVISGRKPSMLKELEVFEPCQFFRGLTFKTHQGKLQFVNTGLHLNLWQFYRDIRRFDTRNVELVITDYEPLTARIAKRHQIPSIGIGHQYAFYYDIPIAGANPFTSWILKQFAFVDYPIGLHWYHFGLPILPPILSQTLGTSNPVIDNKIIVYLPFESLEDTLQLLSDLPDYQFCIYADVEQSEVRSNINLCPVSRRRFLQDLSDCSGVITNAGFELISESLLLGKKLLVKPLFGQLEQLSNAHALALLNRGIVMQHLDRKVLRDWLERPPAEPIDYPDVAAAVVAWIEKKQWDRIDALASDVWGRVAYQFSVNT